MGIDVSRGAAEQGDAALARGRTEPNRTDAGVPTTARTRSLADAQAVTHPHTWALPAPRPTLEASDRLPPITAEAVDLRSVGLARTVVEAELARVISAEAATTAALLAGELMARVATAGLLPLRICVDRADTALRIEVEWSAGPGYLAGVFDQWFPADDAAYGLDMITELADACGVELDGDGGGRLWCRMVAG